VKFAERLFGWDNVPIPVNRPRKLEPSSLRRDWNTPMYHSGTANRWMLVVGKDGLQPR